MEFSIGCPCGKRIVVTAAQAGTEARCVCGQLNTVPLLSELRHGAGQSKYNLGIVDRIRKKAAEGALPSESVCVKCGVQTSGLLHFIVECERTWVTGGGFWKHFFLLLLGPVWIWAQLRKDQNSAEVFGRENVVEVPLRLCSQCQAGVREFRNTRAMRALLQEVPLYQELLREYPEATINVSNKQR
jgi:hypothetical protein